jgi:phosphate starvation-inducible PhoH-like protein
MSRAKKRRDNGIGEVVYEPIFETIKPLNEEQAELIKLIHKNYITVCTGKAGSGKTCVACGVAVQYLLNQKIKKIILTRPMVAAEDIGYRPGTGVEKIDPLIQPLFVELGKFCNVKALLKQNKIVVIPLADMRGINIEDSIILADECQNSDARLLKLLLTRLSDNSKIIMMGDTRQSDLRFYNCDFSKVIEEILRPISEEESGAIGIINLKTSVRHWLVELIADRFEEIEDKSYDKQEKKREGLV